MSRYNINDMVIVKKFGNAGRIIAIHHVSKSGEVYRYPTSFTKTIYDVQIGNKVIKDLWASGLKKK